MNLFFLRIKLQAIFEKFHVAFLAIIFLTIFGTLTFFFEYKQEWDPVYKEGDILDAFFAPMMLLIGQPVVSFPPDTGLLSELVIRTIFFIYPILGQIFIVYAVFEVAFTLFQFETRQEMWYNKLSKNMKNHIIIVGVGHVGKKVIEEFVEKRKENNIVAISLSGNIQDEFVQTYGKKGIPFIFGDGTQLRILEQANIKKASKILALTNSDMTNFRIAIRAKKINPQIKTILRIFDSEFAERIKQLPEVDETVSTSTVSSATFIARALMDGIIATLKTDVKKDTKEKEIFETMVLAKVIVNRLPITDEGAEADDVLDIEKKFNLTILAVNNYFHVKEGYPIKLGDVLMVLGELEEVKKVKKLLEKD